jgi:hypothetical protein
MRRYIILALVLLTAFFALYFYDAKPTENGPTTDLPATTTVATSTRSDFTAAESDETETINRAGMSIKATYPVSSDGGISRQVESFVKAKIADFEDLRPEDAPAPGPMDDRFEFVMDYEVKQSSKTVSYVFESYVYTGGAHGSTIVESLVFDIETGRELTLRDIVPDDRFPALRQALRAKLAADLGDTTTQQTIDFGTKSQEDLTAYYLTDSVIGFRFSSYSVGAYALGIVTAELPLSDVDDLVRIELIK